MFHILQITIISIKEYKDVFYIVHVSFVTSIYNGSSADRKSHCMLFVIIEKKLLTLICTNNLLNQKSTKLRACVRVSYRACYPSSHHPLNNTSITSHTIVQITSHTAVNSYPTSIVFNFATSLSTSKAVNRLLFLCVIIIIKIVSKKCKFNGPNCPNPTNSKVSNFSNTKLRKLEILQNFQIISRAYTQGL